VQGGSQERADKELLEKKIIESYLPEQMNDEDLARLIDEVIKEQGAADVQAMGKVIGAVKAKVGSLADGARIAQMTGRRLKGN